MAVDIIAKPKTKRRQALDINSITFGMRDAFYHFPCPMSSKDIISLASNFSLTIFSMLYADNVWQRKQYSFKNVFANYVVGYEFGKQQCFSMDIKAHKAIIAHFDELEEDDADNGELSIFNVFKANVVDFVKTRQVKDVDEFSEKAMRGDGTLLALVVKSSEV